MNLMSKERGGVRGLNSSEGVALRRAPRAGGKRKQQLPMQLTGIEQSMAASSLTDIPRTLAVVARSRFGKRQQLLVVDFDRRSVGRGTFVAHSCHRLTSSHHRNFVLHTSHCQHSPLDCSRIATRQSLDAKRRRCHQHYCHYPIDVSYLTPARNLHHCVALSHLHQSHTDCFCGSCLLCQMEICVIHITSRPTINYTHSCRRIPDSAPTNED